MKTALVMEGGGMRGLYTAAILDYFIGTGIEFDALFTVSASALFGINLLSKDRYRTIRYNLNYVNDKRFVSLKNLIKTGNMVDENYTFHVLPLELDPFDNEKFKQAESDFYVTVTNLETGLAEHFKVQDAHQDVEVFRASSSLPFVSQPVEIDGQHYLDGGVADSIPYQKAMNLGYDKIVIVLTQPLDYRKSKTNPLLIDLAYRNYPEFADRLKNRYLEYNQTLDEVKALEDQGEVFVIRPSRDLNISRMEKDPQRYIYAYKTGLKDIQANYPDMIDYLKKD